MTLRRSLFSSSRMARNLAEKMRRDKLNTHINELSTLVPMVAGSSKKMDKTSILRLSATYIRMNKTLKPDKNWKLLPKEFGTINLSQYLMEDMEGFLLIITAGSRIIFISHTVEKYLGHSQNELMGQSLYNICHEDDRDELKKNLTPDEGFPSYCGADSQSHDDSSSSDTGTSSSSAQSSPAPASVDPPTSTSCDSPTNTPIERQRRSFYIRLVQKASSRTDQPQYEHVHIIGDLRVPSKLEVHAPHTRSRRQREHSSSENDIILVAMGRLYKEREVSSLCLLEAKKEEYVTRHEPSGKMIYIDHRIAIVAGYMSEEVLGLSAFNFIHPEDVTWTMIALKQMYDKGEGSGTSTYRLKTKNGEYVYMRTCGYLEFDQNTQSIMSFICVNSLITKEEGEKGLEEMRRRFTPNVLNNCNDGIDQTVSATMADLALHGVDNYHKLNIAVRELVSGLHSPASKPENSPRQREETKTSSLPSPSQGNANGSRVVEMVSSTTEVTQPRLTRPTVLREVTSYPVSSSTHQGVLIRVQNHKRTSVSLVKRTFSDEQERCGAKRPRIAKNVKFRRRENGSVDGASDSDRVPATSELQVEVPPINEEDMRQAILLRDEQNRCLDRSEGTVLRSPQFRVLPEAGYGRNALLSYSEDVIGVSPSAASDGDFIALNFPHTSESLNLDFNMHLDGCISPGQLNTVNSSFGHNIGLQESLVGNEVRTEARLEATAPRECPQSEQTATFAGDHDLPGARQLERRAACRERQRTLPVTHRHEDGSSDGLAEAGCQGKKRLH
ncbi:UNVERIFIED_CONTAM: hypothetical protein PYX00_001324 [Menopon gallinae]|uniref:Methoprene-tolerant protein n=1 Tax=Menopon gallinae TaxID=328185 RepID=A0AAW2IDI4_9NEOP